MSDFETPSLSDTLTKAEKSLRQDPTFFAMIVQEMTRRLDQNQRTAFLYEQALRLQDIPAVCYRLAHHALFTMEHGDRRRERFVEIWGKAVEGLHKTTPAEAAREIEIVLTFADANGSFHKRAKDAVEHLKIFVTYTDSDGCFHSCGVKRKANVFPLRPAPLREIARGLGAELSAVALGD